jgi:hypothetical protein
VSSVMFGEKTTHGGNHSMKIKQKKKNKKQE